MKFALKTLFLLLLAMSLIALSVACLDDDDDDDDDNDDNDDNDTSDNDTGDDDISDDDISDDDISDDDITDDDTTPADDDTTPADDDTTPVDDDTTPVDDDTTPVDDDTTPVDDDTTPAEAEWTFVVYMAADNNLYSYGQDDLNEMKTVGSTADVNILVVYDGTTNGDSRLYKVEQGSLTTLASPGELNMGDGQTVRDHVTTLFNDYPAERYALVFWNHGSGWHEEDAPPVYKSICQDGSDWLENDELDSAIAYVRSNTGASTIDLIGFDACLMQMIEIAYYLKDDGTVMVGSEETEGGDGWEYNVFLAQLVSQPTMAATILGEKIVDSFVAQPDATLSVLKLNQMNALASAVDALADELNAVGGISNGQVEDALYDTLYFADWDYIDLSDFANEILDENISAAINTAATGVKNAVSSAVHYYAYGYGGYSYARGVSIYFPDPTWSTFDSDYLDLAFAADTDWDDVIH